MSDFHPYSLKSALLYHVLGICSIRPRGMERKNEAFSQMARFAQDGESELLETTEQILPVTQGK